MRRLFSIAALSVLGAGGLSAHAQTALVIQIAGYQNGNASTNIFGGLGSAQAEGSASFDGSATYGYANVSSGILRGTATPSSGNNGYATVNSLIGDSVLFNGGQGDQASIAFHWDGTLDPYNGAQQVASATLSVDIGYADGTYVSQDYVLMNVGCYTGAQSTAICKIGTSIDETETFSFGIKPGYTVIDLSLALQAADGQSVNFANTASFNLDVPTGVSYTSASGQFLSTAAPVPEPATPLLFLAGLAVMGVGARCRRTTPDHGKTLTPAR